jgi:hypothetical protein
MFSMALNSELIKKLSSLSGIDVDLIELSPEDGEKLSGDAARYEELKLRADAIAGSPEGLQRYFKVPLLYGISAILIFLGIILWTAGISVVAGILCIAAGIPFLSAAAVMFLKVRKASPIYEQAEKIKSEIIKYLLLNRGENYSDTE